MRGVNDLFEFGRMEMRRFPSRGFKEMIEAPRNFGHNLLALP
jgi:hypothetical protein